MTIKLNQDELIKLLNKFQLEPTLQSETDQIYIVMKIADQEVPIFLGIRSEETLLQSVAYIPYQLEEKALNEVSRVLHILNRELDVPGFGLDEQQKLMFYRCVILCPDHELDEKILELYLATTRIAVESFMGAISMVASGKQTVDDFLKKKDGPLA